MLTAQRIMPLAPVLEALAGSFAVGFADGFGSADEAVADGLVEEGGPVAGLLVLLARLLSVPVVLALLPLNLVALVLGLLVHLPLAFLFLCLFSSYLSCPEILSLSVLLHLQIQVLLL